MFRQCWKSGLYICSAVVAPSTTKSFYGKKSGNAEQTGWDRVTDIFSIDDYGEISPELAHIYQTTLFTGLFGACYGGFIFSRKAYLDFIESNEATKFRTHFEAKKELQNYVTINFFKGAAKWSWRLALFGGLYVSYVTAAGAYRSEPSIFDYVMGGMVSGGIFRVNYGLRGVIAGATIGSLMGLTAGCLTLSILRFTGTNYDDIYQWQDENYKSRQRHLDEAARKTFIEEHHREMLEGHDRRVEDKS